MDPTRRILKHHSLVIENDRIIAIDTEEELRKVYTPDITIDLTNQILLPGLIDAHGHAGHTFFPNVIKDTAEWGVPLTHLYKHCVDDAFWYHEARLSALQRAHFGVTTGVNVMGTQSRCDEYSFAKAQSDGYAEVGIRNILCVGPNQGPWPCKLSHYNGDTRIQALVSYEDAIKSLESIVSKLHHANHDLTRVFVTPFQLLCSLDGETSSDMIEGLQEDDRRNAFEMRRIAKTYRTRIHTDAFKGMIHTAAQDPNAMLGEDVHLQHLNGITVDEVAILAKTKTRVSYAPHIGQFKSRTPLIELLQAGVKVAIGTDGSTYNASFDLFTAMRKTQWINRAVYQERNYLPCEKLLEMVTIDAAEVIGWEDELGSIEIGKKADFITINQSKAHLFPHFDIIDQIVRHVQFQDIVHVVVDGKFVLEDGVAKRVDEQELLSRSQQQAEMMINRAHLQAFTKPGNFWGQIQAYYGKQRYDHEWQRKDGDQHE